MKKKNICIILFFLLISNFTWAQDSQKGKRQHGISTLMSRPINGNLISTGDFPNGQHGLDGRLMVLVEDANEKRKYIYDAEVVITSGKDKINATTSSLDAFGVIIRNYPFKDSVEMEITHPDYQTFKKKLLLKPDSWIYILMPKKTEQ